MTVDAIKYRSDIDGLRAVAVMAVVLHHLSSRFVPGGYVGVDVFFVISGYLITTIINREVSDGSFTFSRFYERRIRRIFPALFVVLAAVLIAGYFILLPTDYLATFRGALGTVLFSANFVFSGDLQDGYFAADAKLNPLLHMWSLGVEEQFYVAFPLLMLLVARYWKRGLPLVLVVIATASLSAAQIFIEEKSVDVFFLLPFRAWELMVGAILAIAAFPRLGGRWAREILAVIALLAILVPVFVYDAGTTFPAAAALPPVLGTAALIYVGSSGPTWVGSLLQLRPVVYVGLISYSLYLWHWPLIVFTRFWIGLEPLRPWIPALLLASVVLASASYHFVEQPFRRIGKSRDKRWVLGLGAAATIALASVSSAGVLGMGHEGRFAPSVGALDRARTAPVPFMACESRLTDHTNGLCIIGDNSKAPDVLLWGDSHMLAWLPGFEAALLHLGRSAYVAPNSACPPMLDIVNGADAACRAQNESVFGELRSNQALKTVVMAGFWAKYFAASNIPIFALDGRGGNDEVSPVAFKQTIAAALSLAKNVVVLGPVPTYSKDVPLALAQQEMMGRALDPPILLQQVWVANANFYAAVAELESPRFRFVDVAAWVCRPGCVIYQDGTSLYRDSNHLSPAGAVFFSNQLAQVLASNMNQKNLAAAEHLPQREGIE